VASLAQQRIGREDRKEILGALARLVEKVGQQNGRVGKLEAWRDGHEKWADIQTKRFDDTDRHLADRLERRDSWDGPERRLHPRPRRGTTEE
jgi:hypothetical protein